MHSLSMPRRFLCSALALWAALLIPCYARPQRPEGVFVVKPYLQLGARAANSPKESLSLRWAAAENSAGWWVEFKPKGVSTWTKCPAPTSQRVAVGNVPPFRIFTTVLSPLRPGEVIEYRLLLSGVEVFSAPAKAPKPAGAPQRFVVMGDCGAGTSAQRKIAVGISRADADYLVVTGDLVYTRGRVSEYLDHFWPQYNADAPSNRRGAPLLRSLLLLPALGNHDVIGRDLNRYPDGLAYFYFWSVPRNGPIVNPHDSSAPKVDGPAGAKEAFLQSAGTSYPSAGNYSVDLGDVHWTVLDANPYVNWRDAGLQRWLTEDLKRAQRSKWRFVSFHHPGFNSSRSHYDDQWMRSVHRIFEQGRVDIVFSGHVHNYQRTRPIRAGSRPGEWVLDTRFDGMKNTKPNGVVYIVSGAGGAKLYNPEQSDQADTFQGFTVRLISSTHSYTVVEVAGSTTVLRQISADGKELDRMVLTK